MINIRFIPAGAGNTPPTPDQYFITTVYPRWRGEHSHSTWRIRFLPGLSPLARGTRRRRIELKRYLRFIPAGAGNTSLPRWDMNPEAVYPRWRGEHLPWISTPTGKSGLSPLARGTHIDSAPFDARHRFIPAGAGNTMSTVTPARLLPVYPRWRGEHFFGIAGLKNYGGLSPLARGTPRNWAERLSVLRFIPAGAGNTRWRRRRQILQTVYPRWRGEHCTIMGNSLPLDGLSPLARGTRRINSQVQRPPRFIPAGAGNTCKNYSAVCRVAVYPRWRGEHRDIWRSGKGCCGLSPLARGTLIRLWAS